MIDKDRLIGVGKMFKKIKENKNIQTFLKFINYYLTIGLVGVIIDALISGWDTKLATLYKKLYFLYPRDIVLVLFYIITILNIFILRIKNNRILRLSFIINTTILVVSLYVGYVFYVNR